MGNIEFENNNDTFGLTFSDEAKNWWPQLQVPFVDNVYNSPTKGWMVNFNLLGVLVKPSGSFLDWKTKQNNESILTRKPLNQIPIYESSGVIGGQIQLPPLLLLPNISVSLGTIYPELVDQSPVEYSVNHMFQKIVLQHWNHGGESNENITRLGLYIRDCTHGEVPPIQQNIEISGSLITNIYQFTSAVIYSAQQACFKPYNQEMDSILFRNKAN